MKEGLGPKTSRHQINPIIGAFYLDQTFGFTFQTIKTDQHEKYISGTLTGIKTKNKIKLNKSSQIYIFEQI